MEREEWYMLLAQWHQNPTENRKRVLREILHERGIPNSVRRSLWLLSSGADEKRANQPNLFKELLDTRVEPLDGSSDGKDMEYRIWKDVHRTFPLFRNLFPGLKMSSRNEIPAGTGEYEQHELALFSVLKAVALYFYETGYHQGMNFIAAVSLLVLHIDDEVSGHVQQNSARAAVLSESWFEASEGAFWLVVSLLEDLHLQGLFQTNSSFLQQFVDHFETLVRRLMPRLARHMNVAIEPRFEVVLFSMDWFTTLFSYNLQFDTLMVIWDCLIVARLDEALYLSGLAILLTIAPEVESLTTFSDIMENFKPLVQGVGTHEFREALLEVVTRLVGTSLMPLGSSTLRDIESRLSDPENVVTQHHYDARMLLRGVQLNDSAQVEAELLKYAFPIEVLENALLRASFLGHAGVVLKLVDVGGCDPDCRSTLCRPLVSDVPVGFHAELLSSADGSHAQAGHAQPRVTTSPHHRWLGAGLTPLHISALLGHPTTTRVLLSRGAKLDARCKDPAVRALVVSQHDLVRGNMKRVLMHYHSLAQSVANSDPSSQPWLARNQVGVTPAELAQAVSRVAKRDRSATSRVLEGDICVQCGGVLKRQRTGFWSMMASSFVAQEPGALDRLDRTSPVGVARIASQQSHTGTVMVHSIPGIGRVQQGKSKEPLAAQSTDDVQRRRKQQLAKHLPALCITCGDEWLGRVKDKSLPKARQPDWAHQSEPSPSDSLSQTSATQSQSSVNQRRLSTRPSWRAWQKIAACDLDVPGTSSAWRCQHCKLLLPGKGGRRSFQCKRCAFVFCARCADTMRTLGPKHRKPVRVCRNCHHMTKSCPCPRNPDTGELDPYSQVAASYNGSQFCQHRPTDYLGLSARAPGAGLMVPRCECAQCLDRRYVVHEPLVSGPRAIYHRRRLQTGSSWAHNQSSPLESPQSDASTPKDSTSSVASNQSGFDSQLVLPSPSDSASVGSTRSVPGFGVRTMGYSNKLRSGMSVSGQSIGDMSLSSSRTQVSRHRKRVDPSLAPLEGCYHFPFQEVFTQSFQPTDSPSRFVLRVVAELYDRTLRKSNIAMHQHLQSQGRHAPLTSAVSPTPAVQRARSVACKEETALEMLSLNEESVNTQNSRYKEATRDGNDGMSPRQQGDNCTTETGSVKSSDVAMESNSIAAAPAKTSDQYQELRAKYFLEDGGAKQQQRLDVRSLETKLAQLERTGKGVKAATKSQVVNKSMPEISGNGESTLSGLEGSTDTEQQELGIREEIEAFYREHHPAKLANFEKIIKRFQGREEELLKDLKTAYGVE